MINPEQENTLDNGEQCDPPQASDSDEEVSVRDKESLPGREGPPKPKKGKKRIQGAAKDALLEEMEFSLISKMNSRMSERERRQQDKENNSKKELESEDVFCQALALDLKQLPLYERCMAKQELRNILYKHQMAIMERQTRRSYNPYYNANQNPSNTQQPPVTPTGINRVVSPMQQSSSSSLSSPPPTPIPQSQNPWMWELEK
jgi:hypothetical protein